MLEALVLHLLVERLDVKPHLEGYRVTTGETGRIHSALGAAELHAIAASGSGREEAAGLEGRSGRHERKKYETLPLCTRNAPGLVSLART